MGHLISAHNKSPAGDVASVRIAKQKGSIIRRNSSRIKTNEIVFLEKYFREAIIMKPDIKTGIAIACVASVSVEFGSKERPRNGVFGILPARKMGREPKKERWG